MISRPHTIDSLLSSHFFSTPPLPLNSFMLYDEFMDNNSDGQDVQAVRCHSTDKLIGILAQVDPRTGKRVVLWSDIQTAFPDAQSIWNGGSPVSFLEDELPTRIAYYPGLVLEVITGNQSSAEDSDEELFAGGDNVLQTDLADLHQVLQEVVASNNALEEQILQLQRQQQESALGLEKMKDEQHQAIKCLNHIQLGAQEILTKSYELREYPVPRLFIVLPTAGSRLGHELTNHIPEHFRLYFLCECSSHTVTEGSKTQPEIHLANHEGYDLKEPTAFFKMYYQHISAMMYIVKHGLMTAGTIVRPLTTSRILDRLIATEQLKDSAASLVDNTINFIDEFGRNNEVEIDAVSKNTQFGELEWYLKIKERRRTLGNLFRIVTPVGHIKWVCYTHYQVYCRDLSIRYLRNTLRSNRPVVSEEEIGRIEVTFFSHNEAKPFYDVLAKANGVQELRITLAWNATMDQLKAFAKAVIQAGVIRLEFDGSYLTALTLDVINRHRRLDPILQLPAKSRIQCLHLSGLHKFFARVKDSSFEPSPKLREFSLDSVVSIGEKHRFFNTLYDHFSALTALVLKLHSDYLLTEVAEDILRGLQNLESFSIDFGRLDIIASVSEGTIQDVDLTIAGLDCLTSDDRIFIQRRRFAQMRVLHIEKTYNRRQVQYSYRTRVQDQRKCHLTIISTTKMKLQDLVELATSEIFGELYLSINYREFTLTSNISQHQTQDMAMAIDGIKDLDLNDINFIREGRLTSLTSRHAPREADEDRLATILQHSPRLAYLGIGCERSQAQAIIILVTGERSLKDGGVSSLSTLELMEEKLPPFDVHGECDNSPRIQTHKSFAGNSTTVDMRPWIQLRNSIAVGSQSPHGSVRQHGWYIAFCEDDPIHNSPLAAILDSIPILEGKVSQFKVFALEGSKFTTAEKAPRIEDRSRQHYALQHGE
ncbi:hypothetical protein B0O80DRAFT_465120 [Mortierella sp. GBAus27b]|nr:hypothetical protein B0O80DRAFT_465120 [Mortierella sp. GBAus27b]